MIMLAVVSGVEGAGVSRMAFILMRVVAFGFQTMRCVPCSVFRVPSARP